MKYEKAEVEVISFDDSAEFMVFSNTSAGEAAAKARALSEPEVMRALSKGNRRHTETATYHAETGLWEVYVTVTNKNGHNAETFGPYFY